jgi:hypothetical protein
LEPTVSGASWLDLPRIRREFFGIRGIFPSWLTFRRQKRSFFAGDPGKLLRSLVETASYESNSAVDSPGAAMSAFKGSDAHGRAAAPVAVS